MCIIREKCSHWLILGCFSPRDRKFVYWPRTVCLCTIVKLNQPSSGPDFRHECSECPAPMIDVRTTGTRFYVRFVIAHHHGPSNEKKICSLFRNVCQGEVWGIFLSLITNITCRQSWKLMTVCSDWVTDILTSSYVKLAKQIEKLSWLHIPYREL